MAKHIDTGKKGEILAQTFLKEKGYEILETNWRYSRAELDIIAKDGPILVFIEVKTRTSDFFGRPEEFVNTKKEGLMIQAASAYMEQIGHEWEIRFDIIGIVLRSKNNYELKHYENAFLPG